MEKGPTAGTASPALRPRALSSGKDDLLTGTQQPPVAWTKFNLDLAVGTQGRAVAPLPCLSIQFLEFAARDFDLHRRFGILLVASVDDHKGRCLALPAEQPEHELTAAGEPHRRRQREPPASRRAEGRCGRPPWNPVSMRAGPKRPISALRAATSLAMSEGLPSR